MQADQTSLLQRFRSSVGDLMPKARKAMSRNLKLPEVCLWNLSLMEPDQKRLLGSFRGVTEKQLSK